jgi:CDP-diglyceride synthetase
VPSSLVRRIVTGVSLALGVAALLFVSARYPALRLPWIAAAVLSVLGSLELARMGKLRELRLGLPLVLASSGAALVVGFGTGRVEVLYWLAYAVAGFLSLATVLGRLALGISLPRGAVAWTVGLALWATVALHGLVVLMSWQGISGLIVFLVLCKIGDIFGYFVGRAIGVRHPFTTISPNKTVAGCVASLVAGIVAGLLFGLGGLLPGWGVGALLGLALNLASQAGDLAESWVKRTAGVKDSGTTFGPSGGVLDVVDSLLTSAPVAVLLWTLWYSSAMVNR